MIVSRSEQENWDFAGILMFMLVSSRKRAHNRLEKRIVIWIRLLDARAVSAGGEGLFLREEDDSQETSRSMSPVERDAEAILFDLLSQPPLKFFQKTQSFMGRISKIDLWHRSRGTVSDETEVMAIAAKIQSDNQKLYRHRHPFMDLAISGKLEAPLLAGSLAERITMISRLALANHHATFIHLHRVAYRHLPRTVEVLEAMSMIRQISRDMLDVQGPNDSLPVNMLWPLLMWGSRRKTMRSGRGSYLRSVAFPKPSVTPVSLLMFFRACGKARMIVGRDRISGQSCTPLLIRALLSYNQV